MLCLMSTADRGTARVVRRFLLLWLPAAVVVAAAAALLYGERRKAEVSEFRARQENSLSAVGDDIEADFDGVEADLRYSASLSSLRNLLRGDSASARDRLASDVAELCRHNKAIDRGRFLDTMGREVVRIDLGPDGPVAAAPIDLKDQSNRYWVIQAFRLPSGSTYVSPIELSAEGDAVEVPFKPIVRFAMPVADETGSVRGLVVLDLVVDRTLARVRNGRGAPAPLMLLNADGYWLVGPDHGSEWGFAVAGRKGRTFAREFPRAWARVSSGSTGAFEDGALYVAFRTIRAPTGAAAPTLKLVSLVPGEAIDARLRAARGWMALGSAGLLALLGTAAWIQASADERVRRADAMALERERHFRFLFERNLAGVYRSTTDGRLLDCNDAFVKILGFESKEEALSLSTTSHYAEPEERGRLIDRLLAEGFVQNQEMRLRRKDGSEVWVLMSVGLVGEAPGESMLLEGTFVDISKRKSAEEALRTSERFTRSIVDHMLGGLIITDPRGVIESVNPAAERIFGWSREELVGRHLATLMPQDAAANAEEFLQSAYQKAIGQVSEWVGRRKDGQHFPFELSLFEFETPEGKHFGGNIRDITERREVERLKMEFVSSVSHELRTPLTSIRGSLGLLRSGALGMLPADAEDLVAVAERNVIRLIGLINDILDLERLKDGRIELHVATAPAEGIIARAVESVHAFASQQGIALTTRPSDLVVRVDADRVVQVLVNLVSNAVKFSPRGRDVTVSAAAVGDLAEFRVADRGRGIPPALRSAIFERYRQVEASDAREKGGTGLGLAICKAIIEQHGGSIGVKSEEGVGSTFWFRVPLAVGPRPSISSLSSQAPRLALLVDDDVELLTVLARQLAEKGIGVKTATSAAEALTALRDVKPDVLILDLGLPDGDGQKVVEELRRDPRLASLPLLVYTGRDLTARDRESLTLGPTRHLTKSKASDEEVVRSVHELIRAGRAGRTSGGTRRKERGPDS